MYMLRGEPSRKKMFPLYLGVFNGHLNVVEELLDLGKGEISLVHRQSKVKFPTAVHLAASLGHADISKVPNPSNVNN